MVKKYTAWTHDIHELDGPRTDKHVLVMYADYAAIEARCGELERDRCVWANGEGLGAEYLKAQARIAALEARCRQYEEAFHKAFNQFENITVADTLETAKERAHQMIGWTYDSLPDYALETPCDQQGYVYRDGEMYCSNCGRAAKDILTAPEATNE